MPKPLRTLAKLPRSAQEWELAVIPAPGNHDDPNGASVALVCTQDGTVRGYAMTDAAPRRQELIAVVRRAMTHPAAELFAARPSRLLVTDTALVGLLTGPLAECGVAVKLVSTLVGLQKAIGGMLALLQDSSGDVTGVTGALRALEMPLCAAASQLAQHRPWQRLLNDEGLLLRLKSGPWPAPVAAIFGGEGAQFGVLLYRDIFAWRSHVPSLTLDAPDAARSLDAVVISYLGAEQVPHAMRTVYGAARLPLLDDWHPTFMRIAPGRDPSPLLHPAEAAMTLSCLEALDRTFSALPAATPHERLVGRWATSLGGKVEVAPVWLTESDQVDPLEHNLGQAPATHILGEMSRDFAMHELGLPLPEDPPGAKVPAYMLRALKKDALALARELSSLDGLRFESSNLLGRRHQIVAGMAGERVLGELVHWPGDGSAEADFLRNASNLGGQAVLLILSGGTKRSLRSILAQDIVEARLVRVSELGNGARSEPQP